MQLLAGGGESQVEGQGEQGESRQPQGQMKMIDKYSHARMTIYNKKAAASKEKLSRQGQWIILLLAEGRVSSPLGSVVRAILMLRRSNRTIQA